MVTGPWPTTGRTMHSPLSSCNRKGRSPSLGSPRPPDGLACVNHKQGSPSGEISGTASGRGRARPRIATRPVDRPARANSPALATEMAAGARSCRAVHPASRAPNAETLARIERAISEHAMWLSPCAAAQTKNATPATGAAPTSSRHFVSCVIPGIRPVANVEIWSALVLKRARASAIPRIAMMPRRTCASVTAWPAIRVAACRRPPCVRSRTPRMRGRCRRAAKASCR